MILTLVLALLSSSVMSVTLTAFFARRVQTATANKTDAERQNIITDAATKAVELVADQLTRAEARITELEGELARLRAAHAADIARHLTKIAQYEIELQLLRTRVSELERELKAARAAS